VATQGAVVAVDVSPRAAAIARLNAVRCGVGERVRVVEGDGDWYGALREHDGTLAGVVSNPPYIPSATLATLQAEVRRHEPALALDGGDVDGMRDLTAIAHGAARALRPGGLVALETGGGEQPTKVAALLREGDAFVDVRVVADLAGIARHVVGVRSDAPSAPE
jgi:release factor glutamine methyltransferase